RPAPPRCPANGPPLTSVVTSPLQAADLLTIRRNNLALVLRVLHDEGPRSRAAVAAETGLNKATVSRPVAELIDRGLVQELGLAAQRRRGRPPPPVHGGGRRVAALGVGPNLDF